MESSTRQGQPASSNFFGTLRGRIEFGDALVFLYALVFVRQYFWVVQVNSIAWIASFLVAIVCWYYYFATKQFPSERSGREFWLFVGLPLLAAYSLRVAFPDHSFDVLNYRLLHAERSLRGTLFAPGDFFPTPGPYNPAPDTVTGLSRMILGYRLGTIVNLFALIWAAQIGDKILRSFIGRRWLRSACVLLAILAEHLLFEVSTYMVDLLALPLLLEATSLTLRSDEVNDRGANYVRIALLIGASAAFKLTNLTAALPIVLVCAYQALLSKERLAPGKLPRTILSTLIAFGVPLIPFTVYIYRITGNPVFPLANVFFKSPYWPTHGGWDNRWGPSGFWQTIVWPILIFFEPERHSELAVYSGRLTIGFIVALAGLVLAWRDTRARTLCLVLLASCLLWSAGSVGYSRYGLYQELLAGLTIIAVACVLIGNASRAKLHWRTVLATLIFMALASQATLACVYVLRTEWGSRPTLLSSPGAYAEEGTLLLRDHSLKKFLTTDERILFDRVPVWIESSVKTSGIEALLNERAAIISVSHPEYFYTRQSRQRFIQAIEDLPSDRMFSLCLTEELASAKQAIIARGLEVGNVTGVDIPFFSPRDRIGMMLIEVLRPQEPEARSKFESSWMNAAFPDSDYREQITALNGPTTMRAGEKVFIRFKVKNLGYSTWPSVGNKEGRYQVNIANRWLDIGGTVLANASEGRAAMASDLQPGGEVELPLLVTAPGTPGDYLMEVDMVHEGVTWFYERGAKTLRLRVRVEP